MQYMVRISFWSMDDGRLLLESYMSDKATLHPDHPFPYCYSDGTLCVIINRSVQTHKFPQRPRNLRSGERMSGGSPVLLRVIHSYFHED